MLAALAGGAVRFYCSPNRSREGTIKAILLREFGAPGVMRLEEVPTPEPGPDEVLIEVAAVSVNRTLDCIVRSGKYPRPVKLPHVPGVDPVGTVVLLGKGVTSRKLGDRVAVSLHLGNPGQPLNLLGIDCWGGYAQYVKLPVKNTYLLPEGLDFHTATVVARHAPLAHNMLQAKVKLKAGEWVLVMGASGGLASFLVQLARQAGAKVIAAAGTDHHVEVAQELGAPHGINYRRQDLTAEVMKITGGRGVDVVCENIGDPELFPKAFAALGPRGRLITAGGHGGGTVPLSIFNLYVKGITIFGSTEQTDEDMVMSLKAAAEGHLRALIDQVLPLADAAKAHEIIEGRGGTGKVLLAPG
jgi:NADPH:quinone reductase-like Zn-dependent oxidoreductase